LYVAFPRHQVFHEIGTARDLRGEGDSYQINPFSIYSYSPTALRKYKVMITGARRSKAADKRSTPGELVGNCPPSASFPGGKLTV
jgi:hypothetical protein